MNLTSEVEIIFTGNWFLRPNRNAEANTDGATISSILRLLPGGAIISVFTVPSVKISSRLHSSPWLTTSESVGKLFRWKTMCESNCASSAVSTPPKRGISDSSVSIVEIFFKCNKCDNLIRCESVVLFCKIQNDEKGNCKNR